MDKELRAGSIRTALTALVAIQAIHPFADGNGRVARVMFHGLLGIHPDAYLPLHEVAAVTKSAYLLSLREASYFQRWESIATFVWRAMRQTWLQSATRVEQLRGLQWPCRLQEKETLECDHADAPRPDRSFR